MTSIPAATPDAPKPDADGARAPRAVWQTKWLVPGVAALAYFACWWVAGRLNVSHTHGYDGSLIATGHAVTNVVIAAVAIFSALAVGTVLASAIRPDAGLFAAALALLALGNRGRTVVTLLHDAHGNRGIFLLLALELLLLYVLLAAGWWVLYQMQRSGRLHDDAACDGLADRPLVRGAGWQALATQAIVTALAVMFLAQSEDKKQAVAAVALGAFAGAFFPYWQRGARPSVWYWAGPLFAGLAGYLFAYASPPVGFEMGRPDLNGAGILGALAKPLPLDYASMGTAGALLGYWMRRTSVRDRLAHAAAHSTAK